MSSKSDSMNDELAPIFTELGKALQICQAFESTLCFLLALMTMESSTGGEAAFQAAWDFHSKKPLGLLLKALRDQIEVPAELDVYLGVGVDKRNQIVHGFMTRNAMKLYEPKARMEIEHELVELKREVKKRDIVANMRIPVHAGHQFRSMPGHDSGACRASIPIDAGRGCDAG